LSQGGVIFGGIVGGNIAPVARSVAAQAFVDGSAVEAGLGVGRNDDLADGEFGVNYLGHKLIPSRRWAGDKSPARS
jgi:hypothetical protein